MNTAREFPLQLTPEIVFISLHCNRILTFGSYCSVRKGSAVAQHN